MTLLPMLPIVDDESLISYLARVAEFHSGLSLFRFLKLVDVALENAVHPTQSDLERIASLTGQSIKKLADHVISNLGSRQRSFRTEAFHAEFANFTQTTFCPACLLEDGKESSATSGKRVGRTVWRFEPVRACHRHEIALTRHSNFDRNHACQDMALVAPSDYKLASLLEAATKMKPTRLQVYVENRLKGAEGPAWLDSQNIDEVSRTCEVLGAVITKGPRVSLSSMSVCSRAEAENTGFDYASEGPDGVKAALKYLLDNTSGKIGQTGPQYAFGRLYQWLQFKKGSRSVGPIADVTIDFILDHFPVTDGVSLFGQMIERGRMHSVESLARHTGANVRTINRVAVATGLVEGDSVKVDSSQLFDRAVGEAMVERYQNAIQIVDLHKYINCSSNAAQSFLQNGVIPRLYENLDIDVKVLRKVAVGDADAFLEDLVKNGNEVLCVSAGMVNITTASRMAKCSIVDIVMGILSSELELIEVLSSDLRFQKVYVDPAEIRRKLHVPTDDGRITLQGAAQYLGMHTFHVSKLSKIFDGGGVPFLEVIMEKRSNDNFNKYFDFSSVKRFKRNYIPLVEFAKSRNRSPKWCKEKLDHLNINPIADKPVLGRYYYKRSDLIAIE